MTHLDSSPPWTWELPGPPRAEEYLTRLAECPYPLLLDSARRHDELGRYSFLMADPFEVLLAPAGGNALTTARWQELDAVLRLYAQPRRSELPPFQGGAAGIWGYELADFFEHCIPPHTDEFAFPRLCLGLYDVVLAWDHARNKAWLISQGWPETDPDRRRRRAYARKDEFLCWLDGAAPPTSERRGVPERMGVPDARHVSSGMSGIYSNFTAEEYQAAVTNATEFIRRGDIFQVNLSQRLLRRFDASPLRLYRALREAAPAPFAAYFDMGQDCVLSASPERFLRVSDGWVEARPIKGTRRGMDRPIADLFARSELFSSPKDRAENTMIVDLLRNDLSRVCDPNSVRVPQWCGLESYDYVHHLVSVIQGRLRPSTTPLELIAAAFPGGSVTGAPKIRAMAIIQALEQVARGAYCGGIGYIGFDGSMDMNILIRTITCGGGWLRFPVGGAVVVDSDPREEWQETWHKAAGMLAALESIDPR